MAKYRGWTCSASQSPVVVYNAKLDQVYIINDTVAARNKEMWKYDFESETWGYGIASMAKASGYSNFALDKNSDIAVVERGATNGLIKIWDDKPAAQNIRLSTGWLALDNPGSIKQFYEVVAIAKYGSGINLTVNVMVNGNEVNSNAGYPDTGATGLWSGSDFGRTRHKVPAGNDVSDAVTFVEVVISGSANARFELHSISIIHRDKGVV